MQDLSTKRAHDDPHFVGMGAAQLHALLAGALPLATLSARGPYRRYSGVAVT